jgi:hypothetical protein
VDDSCDQEKGEDVDDDCIAKEVDEDGLEIEVDAVLHAEGRETDDNWT